MAAPACIMELSLPMGSPDATPRITPKSFACKRAWRENLRGEYREMIWRLSLSMNPFSHQILWGITVIEICLIPKTS